MGFDYLSDIRYRFDRASCMQTALHKQLMMELTLLFIHGAGGGYATWRLQLLKFKNAQAIILPGHPEGQGLDTIEDYADFVTEYVQAKQIHDLTLVGHSMGGAIAIEYALQEPNLKGLVLVGTGARLRVRQDLLSTIHENYSHACAMLAKLSVAPECDPIIIDRIRNELLKVSAEVTYGDFLACDKFDRMREVNRIQCPTLVICGTQDQLTPFKYSEYLHEKIRNSRLVKILQAGHSTFLEKHRIFNQLLWDFETFLKVDPH